MSYYKNRESGVVLWLEDDRINSSTYLSNRFEFIPHSQYEVYGLPDLPSDYVSEKIKSNKLLIRIPDEFNEMSKKDLYKFAVIKHKLMPALPDKQLDEIRIVIKEAIKFSNFEITSDAGDDNIFPEEFYKATFDELKSWALRKYNIELDHSSFITLESFRAHAKKVCLDAHKNKLEKDIVKSDSKPQEEEGDDALEEAEKKTRSGPLTNNIKSINKKADLLSYAERKGIDLSYFNGASPTIKELKSFIINAEKGELEV